MLFAIWLRVSESFWGFAFRRGCSERCLTEFAHVCQQHLEQQAWEMVRMEVAGLVHSGAGIACCAAGPACFAAKFVRAHLVAGRAKRSAASRYRHGWNAEMDTASAAFARALRPLSARTWSSLPQSSWP